MPNPRWETKDAPTSPAVAGDTGLHPIVTEARRGTHHETGTVHQSSQIRRGTRHFVVKDCSRGTQIGRPCLDAGKLR